MASVPSGSALLRRILPLLVAVAAIVPFLPALDGGFNWDDIPNLVENPHYRGLGWTQLKWMFTTNLLGHYVPLAWMTLGLNYVLGGMNPWGYHLTNLLLHGANAALFYFAARRLLALALPPHPGLSPGGGEGALTLGAVLAALVFGVHPLRVESVTWVTERRDVLCGVFFLLAVLAYLRGVRSGGTIQRWWWTLSVGAFVLALLSKAAAMPLPAVLLLLDIYPLRRVDPVGWRRLLTEKMPYLGLAVASAVMALIAQTRAEAVTGYQDYGIAARVAMACYSFMFYPWKFVWSAELSPLYELPPQVNPFFNHDPVYPFVSDNARMMRHPILEHRRVFQDHPTAFSSSILFPPLGIQFVGAADNARIHHFRVVPDHRFPYS